MTELTRWESVHHLPPTDALIALVGEENSFEKWPPAAVWITIGSMQMGVALGFVAPDFAKSIVGTVSFCSSGLELRACWEPPK